MELSGISNLTNLCRVCLTSSKIMVPLTSQLFDDQNVSVVSALEKAMDTNVYMDKSYPAVVCPMCSGLLKISYNLRVQFEESTNKLKERFATTENNIEVSECAVELVCGRNKYDLNDVVIVEKEPEEAHNFDSFLKNLGKTVSATFVDKSYKYNGPLPENQPDEVVILERHLATNKQKPAKSQSTKETNECAEIAGMLITSKFQCDSCGKGYDRKAMFDKHVVKCSVNTKNPSSNLDHAYTKNQSTDAEENDENKQLGPKKVYSCELCNKSFLIRARYLKHRKNCSFQCSICLKVFATKTNMSRHIHDVHKKKQHPCSLCDFVGHSTSSLIYHKLKHFDKQFQCDVCKKKFLTKHILKTHILHSHEQPTRDICPVCGKVFHNRSSLKYHLRIHNDDRNYICSQCPRRFYILNALKRHLRTHTGIRPYKCSYCDKFFFSTSERMKHEWIHTGFRPYHCKHCNKGFTTTHNMKIHLMTHPGNYMCDICDKTFAESDSLSFHFKTKHNVESVSQIQNEEFIEEDEEILLGDKDVFSC